MTRRGENLFERRADRLSARFKEHSVALNVEFILARYIIGCIIGNGECRGQRSALERVKERREFAE